VVLDTVVLDYLERRGGAVLDCQVSALGVPADSYFKMCRCSYLEGQIQKHFARPAKKGDDLFRRLDGGGFGVVVARVILRQGHNGTRGVDRQLSIAPGAQGAVDVGRVGSEGRDELVERFVRVALMHDGFAGMGMGTGMLGLSRDANVRPWRVVKSFSSCRSQDMCSELCIVQYMPMLEITASREREFSHGRHPSARVSIVRSADEPGWLFGDGMRSATMSDDYSDVFDVAMVLACTDSVYEMFSVLNLFDILRDTRGLAMMDFFTEGFQCNGR
jgi:hypothetical protein